MSAARATESSHLRLPRSAAIGLVVSMAGSRVGLTALSLVALMSCQERHASRSSTKGAASASGVSASNVSASSTAQPGSATQSSAACLKGGGLVVKDTTLTRACSPYELARGLQVLDGATLTIEPGVELRFAADQGLEVGAADGRAGRLVAEGSAEAPITLVAAGQTRADAKPQDSAWRGIRFYSGTLPGSVLAHARVSGAGLSQTAGAAAEEAGCVTVTGVKHGALRLVQLQLESCNPAALVLRGGGVQLSGLHFAHSSVGLSSDAQSAAALPTDIEYREVANNVITGGVISDHTVWGPQGRPFDVRGPVTVGGANRPALILQAGVELRFGAEAGLLVGTQGPGVLKAMGTRESPVKLQPLANGGAWRGLRFGAETLPGSSLEFTELSGADGGVRIETPPKALSIQDSTLANNAVDVAVVCRSEPKLTRVRYTSKRGLVREPCK
ncbi:MAG TPA: hypothetical protein VFQ61_05380 [Polyangiaceae bacterium]|nr:hypothetical protein [Polyangiaceae bacterium]